MAEYVNPPVDADQSSIEEAIYEYIQRYYPDWEPREGHLAVILTEAFAQEQAALRQLASDVPPEIFRYFGNLIGLPSTDAAPAFAESTWTVRDTSGYTIPDGTTVRMLIGGDEYMVFATEGDVTIPSGQNSTVVGEVHLVAIEEGSHGNGLTDPVELMDILDYVTGITLAGPTEGGSDLEDIDAYLDRLADRTLLFADRPILAEDFATYARTVSGVTRAMALDTYDPETQTYGNERMVTVIAIDDDGVGVGIPVRNQIQALLDAAREANFVVKTMDPTTTPVTVAATVRAHVGADTQAVKAATEQAVKDYLDPSRWGTAPDGDPTTWVKAGWEKVRFSEIMAVINNVDGVNYIENDQVVINGQPNTTLTLAGEAPLPESNANVTITVNPGP